MYAIAPRTRGLTGCERGYGLRYLGARIGPQSDAFRPAAREAMTYGSKEHGPGHRPVGVWVRVSTANQAAGDSPETHEQRALGYAAAKGWEVVEVYRLAGVSGKNVRDHSECRRMLEDIKSGKIEALIFSKLARLARNTRDLLDFADYFREHEAD